MPAERPLWERMGAAVFWRAAWEESARRRPRQGCDAAEEAFWRDLAPRYDERSPLTDTAPALVANLRALLQPGWQMLEIGPGPGTFTRRLAPGLSRVTGVEPSAAMRAEFARRWPGTPPATLCPERWEDAPDGLSADLVLAANALYCVAEIAPALARMTCAARSRVALVQTVGRPHAEPLVVPDGTRSWERQRANALADVLEEMGQGFERRRCRIAHPDELGRADLITWAPR